MSTTPAPEYVVARVRQARTTIWIQIGLLVLGIALLILGAAAQDDAARAEARRAAEKVSSGEAAVNGLLGLAGLVAVVLLLVYGPKLMSFAARARQVVVAAEAVAIANALWGMRGLNPVVIVFQLVAVGLAARVIMLLRGDDVAQAFASAPSSDNRFEIKGL
ncbi:MAG TPA: hypothetical protein VMZ22_10025 [Acidimicrobiales bacterium]|nr:hypothetical protein [Acidimicrobiales bacterium]